MPEFSLTIRMPIGNDHDNMTKLLAIVRRPARSIGTSGINGVETFNVLFVFATEAERDEVKASVEAKHPEFNCEVT